jgi:hypothetical protein
MPRGGRAAARFAQPGVEAALDSHPWGGISVHGSGEARSPWEHPLHPVPGIVRAIVPERAIRIGKRSRA